DCPFAGEELRANVGAPKPVVAHSHPIHACRRQRSADLGAPRAHQRDLGGLRRVGHSGPLRWHFDNPTDIRELTAGNTASVNHLYTERHRFPDPSVLAQLGTPAARSEYAKYPAVQGIRRHAARPLLFARSYAPADTRL